MSFISEVVPQVSAGAIQNQSAPTSRSEGVSANTQNQSQPAAIVSLSQDSKSRAVSSGSNKFVDSSYGSEKYRGNKDRNSSKENGKASINLVA